MTGKKPPIWFYERHFENAIIARAELYCKVDDMLHGLYADLSAAREDGKRLRAERLKASGVPCRVCKEEYLPLPDDSTQTCSVGCRIRFMEGEGDDD